MSTRALQFDILLLGFRDPDTDAPLAFGVVNFLSAGTSDPLTVWDTKEKTGAKTSVTLDVNGQAQVYGDGVYKLEVLDSDAAAVSYSPIDNVKIRAVSTNVVETNTTYTATTDDDLILCDTSGGAVLINLYPAADFVAGLTIKNISVAGNDVTVDPDGAELIDGAATQALVDGQANEFFSNGSGWFGNGVSTGTNFSSTSLVFGDGLKEDTSVGVTTIAVDGIVEQESSAEIRVKVIDIGDWDMDATASVSIAHGIAGANITKIRSIAASVNEDTGVEVRNLESPDPTSPQTDTTLQGNIVYVSETNVVLSRLTGGIYDSTNYNSIINPVGGSRGWITIWYEA